LKLTFIKRDYPEPDSVPDKVTRFTAVRLTLSLSPLLSDARLRDIAISMNVTVKAPRIDELLSQRRRSFSQGMIDDLSRYKRFRK
jgi:hypothetical protein